MKMTWHTNLPYERPRTLQMRLDAVHLYISSLDKSDEVNEFIFLKHDIEDHYILAVFEIYIDLNWVFKVFEYWNIQY